MPCGIRVVIGCRTRCSGGNFGARTMDEGWEVTGTMAEPGYVTGGITVVVACKTGRVRKTISEMIVSGRWGVTTAGNTSISFFPASFLASTYKTEDPVE